VDSSLFQVADKEIFQALVLEPTLVLVEAVAHTTARITLVELVVLELWSLDTKSELCPNDNLLHGGL
jgi:hypothetical protein